MSALGDDYGQAATRLRNAVAALLNVSMLVGQIAPHLKDRRRLGASSGGINLKPALGTHGQSQVLDLGGWPDLARLVGMVREYREARDAADIAWAKLSADDQENFKSPDELDKAG